MAEKSALDLQEILKSPIVKKAVADINRELIERRAFVPPICKVFSHAYTVLEDTDRYRFTIDTCMDRRYRC